MPWHQDARPRSVICLARCPRMKKGAAKKSRDREKPHQCSPRHLVKTARRLKWRSADVAKTKLRPQGGPGNHGRLLRLHP